MADALPRRLLARMAASRLGRAFRHRNLRLYVLGQGLSLIGTWMQRVAIGWLAWELTGSAAWLGALAMADLAPSILLAPLAGAVADRFDRLRVGMLFQSLALLQAAALAAFTFAGHIDILLLLLFQGLQGAATAFWQPARFALIPSLVPREDLGTTIAVTSINFNLARFIGPALAAPVILGVGVWAAFALNALSYLAFLWAAQRLTLPPRPPRPAARPNVLVEAVGGVRAVARHPGIGPLLLVLILFALTVRPVTELLPGFAAAFGRGAGGLSAMTAIMGVGALVAGTCFALLGGGRRLTAIFAGAIALGGAASGAFALAPSFAVALACLFLLALCEAAAGIATQTLLQHAIGDEMRGRVLSAYGVIIRGGPAAGALLLGLAAELFGLHVPVALAALVALAAGLAAFATRRRWAGTLDGGSPPGPAPLP